MSRAMQARNLEQPTELVWIFARESNRPQKGTPLPKYVNATVQEAGSGERRRGGGAAAESHYIFISRPRQMTDFLTRVMLNDGDEQDYLALDRAMQNFHFGKTIQSRFGQTYALPTGTYLSQSHNMSATDVRNLALVAAHPIGRRVDIITTGGETAFFLQPPKPETGT